MTGLAASEIGQDDAGVLQVGRRADLLICQGDVIDQPQLLDKGAMLEVVKDGVWHAAQPASPKSFWPALMSDGTPPVGLGTGRFPMYVVRASSRRSLTSGLGLRAASRHALCCTVQSPEDAGNRELDRPRSSANAAAFC